MASLDHIQKLAMSLPVAERTALARILLSSLPKEAASIDESLVRMRSMDASPPHACEQLRYTFKVDASYHLERKVTGIGIVIHASDKPGKNGRVIEEIAELYADIPANLPEKFAILRALELARERNYQRLAIRSDYNYLRRALKEDYQNDKRNPAEPVHRLILQHARGFTEVKFPYHPRRKNLAAHVLARYAVRELEPRPCPEILRAIHQDDGLHLRTASRKGDSLEFHFPDKVDDKVSDKVVCGTGSI